VLPEDRVFEITVFVSRIVDSLSCHEAVGIFDSHPVPAASFQSPHLGPVCGSLGLRESALGPLVALSLPVKVEAEEDLSFGAFVLGLL
jgi:hypothetical protein